MGNWIPPDLQASANLMTETWASFGQAAALFPPFRRGRPVSPSCLWRWHRHGVRLPDGTVVRLEAMRVAGRFLTSVEAVHRFIARQQADAGPVVEAATADIRTTPNARTPARRARDSENALGRLQDRRKTNEPGPA